MRFLLDTHTLLWWVHEPERLSADALAAIRDPNNDILVSAVSAMEIATKQRKGRLEYRSSLADAFVEQIELEGFGPLAITCEHAGRAGGYAPDHADPWDRILAAQAQLEDLQLVTCDAKIQSFGIETFW